MSAVGHAMRIARVESRRSLRNSLGSKRKAAYTVGFLLVFSPILYGWGRMSYEFGRTVAAGTPVPTADIGIQLVALAAVFVVFAAIRTVQTGRPDGAELLLTATTTRAVLLGTFVHQTAQLLSFVAVPLLAVIGGFALGADLPVVVPAAVVLLVPFFAAVTLLGAVLGMLFSIGLLASPLLRRASQAIGLVVFVGILALSFALTYPAASGGPTPLARLPLAYAPFVHYVDLVFVGTGLVDWASPASLGSLLVVLGSLPALFAVADRLAPHLWFADVAPRTLLQGRFVARSAETKEQATASTTAESPVTDAQPVAASTAASFPRWHTPPSVGVATLLWVRWLRVPVRFSTVVPLVGVLVAAAIGVASDPDSIPVLVPGALLAVGIYISGAVFGLNPLGEAGSTRPLEALSPRRSGTFLRGHVAAGLAVGAPLTLLGAAAFVLLNAMSLPAGVVLVLLSPLAAALSACLAVLLGTVLPRFETTQTFRGFDVASPSPWAILGHVFLTAPLVLVGAAPVLAATFVPDLRPYLLVGAVVSVVVLSGASAVAYRLSESRYAAARTRVQ